LSSSSQQREALNATDDDESLTKFSSVFFFKNREFHRDKKFLFFSFVSLVGFFLVFPSFSSTKKTLDEDDDSDDDDENTNTKNNNTNCCCCEDCDDVSSFTSSCSSFLLLS